MTQLKEAIRRIVSPMIKPALIYGVVKSFDEQTWSVTIELNRGGVLDEVTILSTIEVGETGLFVEPEIDSVIICGLIENIIENLTIVKLSAVKRIRLMASEIVEIQGDSEGGIVKSSKVHSELKQVKDNLNDLKKIFSQWVPVPQDGGAALKAQLSSWLTPLMITEKKDFENEKVKHGN